MDTQGLSLQRFSHYTFNAGENRGEPPTFHSKSELTQSLNVGIRSKGISTRNGSTVLNVDGSGYPNPIDPTVGTKFSINSIFGFNYGDRQSIDLFTGSTSVYKDSTSPTVLDSSFTTSLKFQFQKVADVAYLTNGTDAVKYYQPLEDDTQLYTAGYDTPGVFTATAAAGVGLADGEHRYYVTLYDQTTRTESNRQTAYVSVTTGAGNNQVQLAALPLDPEDRSTHWRIYRRDPSGYYEYDLVQIPYDALDPTYLDVLPLTGQSRVAPNDNFKPDPCDTLCQHGKLMVYAKGSTVTWSKNYRYQNVPTQNRELLEDDSNDITKVVSFKKAVVVFKTDSIYVIIGSLTLRNYEVKRISGIIGTVSPDSVKEGKEGIFFFGSDGKPRFITPTDFESTDLRDETDISYKYRDRFSSLNPTQYQDIFAVIFSYRDVAQYRLFVPISVNSDYTNECWVYDYGLARRNGGDSAWFRLRYNINMKCAATVTITEAQKRIHIGDDYSLLWAAEEENNFFDGSEFFREEVDGTVSINSGTNTITLSSANEPVNKYVGMQIILYDAYSVRELFRSRVVSNGGTDFVVEDVIPTISSIDPAVSIGGYVVYFATAQYTTDHASSFRLFKASVLLNFELGGGDCYFFTLYDFSESFNYLYDYINNVANPSFTPKSDMYLLIGGTAAALYDTAIYDTDSYNETVFGTLEFELNNKFLPSHVSWGLITREPSQPFTYVGSTIFYLGKGTVSKGAPSS